MRVCYEYTSASLPGVLFCTIGIHVHIYKILCVPLTRVSPTKTLTGMHYLWRLRVYSKVGVAKKGRRAPIVTLTSILTVKSGRSGTYLSLDSKRSVVAETQGRSQPS